MWAPSGSESLRNARCPECGSDKVYYDIVG